MSREFLSHNASAIWLKLRLIGVAGFVLAFCIAGRSFAQQGFELGDFESIAGTSAQNGPLFPGPAGETLAFDGNNNPSGVWSDFGDVQPQYYPNDLFNMQLSSVGATHGNSSVLINQIPGVATAGASTFNGVMMLINPGNSVETSSLIHASALKFDVTFDRSQLINPQNLSTTSDTAFTSFSVGINTPVNFPQAHVSYDSFSTLNSSGFVTAQPNYEAGTYLYHNTTTFPGTDPDASATGQSPPVTGTGLTTVTLTVDFTTNLRNGADPTGMNLGNGTDSGSPPTWKAFHNAMVTGYNSVDPGSTTGQTYAQDGNFYNLIHIYYSVGTFDFGGVYIDNVRLIEPGDFNQDGVVTVADVQAGMNALANLSAYEAAGNMNSEDMKLIGDVNGDGVVNNADIQALISTLANTAPSGSSTISAVPEPSSFLLLALGALILPVRYRRRFSVAL